AGSTGVEIRIDELVRVRIVGWHSDGCLKFVAPTSGGMGARIKRGNVHVDTDRRQLTFDRLRELHALGGVIHENREAEPVRLVTSREGGLRLVEILTEAALCRVEAPVAIRDHVFTRKSCAKKDSLVDGIPIDGEGYCLA